jgi:tol-pal system protein YbgF
MNMMNSSSLKAREFSLPCLAALFGLGLFCVLPVTAHAQTDVQSRVNRLENEIETLSRAVYKGEEPPAGAFSSPSADAARAAMETRINQLETQLRELTGQMEQQTYEIKMLKEQAEAAKAAAAPTTGQVGRPFGENPLTSSIYGGAGTTQDPAASTGSITGAPPQPGGMQQISGVNATQPGSAPYTATTGGQLGTLSQTQDGSTYKAPASNDPSAVYEAAFALVKDGSYDQAEIGLTDFLTRFPDHTLAPNARYWLGETYYVRKDYAKASRVFAEAYQKSPKGPKAPDNLLKLGLSLAGSGDVKSACIALTQLQTEYGGTANPVIDRAIKEKEAIGCQ